MTQEQPAEWKRGLPPGKYYEGMFDDFEVYLSPVGLKWHRRRSQEEIANRRALNDEEQKR